MAACKALKQLHVFMQATLPTVCKMSILLHGKISQCTENKRKSDWKATCKQVCIK